ncbi:MAG TPA: mitofilin family membrane protein [Stellaceae bacterium]|nr:mitofilin family membrane protein [Stellaceae bacterium]
MSRKHSLPNVDEEALASLARQFPSMNVTPPEARDERPAVTPAPEPAPSPAQAAADAAFPANEASASDAPLVNDAPVVDRRPLVADAGPDGPTSTGAAATAPAAPVERRRGGGRVIASLARLRSLVALTAAVSALAPPQLRAWLTATIGEPLVVDALTGNRAEIDARLAAAAAALKEMQDRSAAIAARLDAIEAVGGSSNTAARRVEAVEAAIKTNEARGVALAEAGKAAEAEIGKLSTQVDLLAASIKDNAARIASVEGGVKTSATVTAALVKTASAERLFLTTLHLRSATQSPSPFSAELAAVRAAAGDGNAETQAALKVLTPLAQSGVSTITELRDSFIAVVVPRVIAASSGQKGLGDRTKAWVQSMFVSRDDAVGGDRNATILALAERSLAKGQLTAAVDQVVLLEDQASLVTTEWLKAASARLLADKAVATLTAQAFDRLAIAN